MKKIGRASGYTLETQHGTVNMCSLPLPGTIHFPGTISRTVDSVSDQGLPVFPHAKARAEISYLRLLLPVLIV